MKNINMKKIIRINNNTILMGGVIGFVLIILSNISLTSSNLILYGSLLGAFIGSIIYKDKFESIESNWIEKILGFIFDIFIASIIMLFFLFLAWLVNII